MLLIFYSRNWLVSDYGETAVTSQQRLFTGRARIRYVRRLQT